LQPLTGPQQRFIELSMEQLAPSELTIARGPGWCLSRVICTARKGERHAEERHRRHVIAMVQSGTFTYHGAQGRTLLHAGSLLLGNANACYACGHDHGDGDQCLALQMDDGFFHELAGTVTGAATYAFPLTRAPIKASWLRPLTALQHATDADYRAEAAIAFAASVIAGLSGSAAERSLTLRDELRIGRVLRHIGHEWDAPLDLEHLASLAAMSKFHFLRVFRGVTGATPYQHILRLRLSAAARRLLAGNEPVTAIALACGFGDISTFNRTFKSTFGSSPTAYRRNSV
jgi:AraC family transcriptional regulator